MNNDETSLNPSPRQRIAKIMARAGLCSRRDAERWIQEGRVKVNGEPVTTPAMTVLLSDQIEVDGQLLEEPKTAKIWLFHKPRGILTTHKDPGGRPTLFSLLPPTLGKHIISVGRLDMMSEGLILLTNSGPLARALEHPKNQIPRTYRVRIFGLLNQEKLTHLNQGITIEGVSYGPIEWHYIPSPSSNYWIEMTLREGKNREIRRIIEALGGKISRLVRTGYGLFKLESLPVGHLQEVSSSRVHTLLKTLGIEEHL